MAVLPKPFDTTKFLVVVEDTFYRVRNCEHMFKSCFNCSLWNTSCTTFREISVQDSDCPFLLRNQFLEKYENVTDDMKKEMEQFRKNNPEAKWFLVEYNEGNLPKLRESFNKLKNAVEDLMSVAGTPKTTFRDIAGRIADLQEKKNESYGNAFGQSCDKYGVVSALTRLNDKLNRLDSLLQVLGTVSFRRVFHGYSYRSRRICNNDN